MKRQKEEDRTSKIGGKKADQRCQHFGRWAPFPLVRALPFSGKVWP